MNTEELLEERAKTHGDYTNHASITQELKSVMRQGILVSHRGAAPPVPGFAINLTAMDRGLNAVMLESIDMICHKLGRIAAGNPNEPDHWDDIAGYAKLCADRIRLAVARAHEIIERMREQAEAEQAEASDDLADEGELAAETLQESVPKPSLVKPPPTQRPTVVAKPPLGTNRPGGGPRHAMPVPPTRK